MANINSVFGFRPVKQVGAGYNAAASNEYTIANNETNAIFQGDPVVLNANGSVSRGNSAGAELIGIFNGCFMKIQQQRNQLFLISIQAVSQLII